MMPVKPISQTGALDSILLDMNNVQEVNFRTCKEDHTERKHSKEKEIIDEARN